MRIKALVVLSGALLLGTACAEKLPRQQEAAPRPSATASPRPRLCVMWRFPFNWCLGPGVPL